MGASVKHTASYIAVRDSAGRNVARVHKSQGGVGISRLFAESLDFFKSTGKGPSELAASLAASQAEIARLRGALTAAANYIDTLGGVSTSYRQL